MKRLNRFVSESLLDDENELINSGDLSPIKLTGIPGVDNIINKINGKMSTPIVYSYVEKLIEISKKISIEFKEIDLNSILSRNIIKNIDELAVTKLNNQKNPLELKKDIDSIRAASDFIHNMMKSPKLKEFTNSNIFKEDTFLGSASQKKFESGYVLSWSFYDDDNEKFDVDELEKNIQSIKVKTDSIIKFDRRDVDDEITLRVYFYKN